jgi:hypothetical protein
LYATTFFETKILNTFNNITAVGEGPLFVGLFLSNPRDSGTEGIEVGYAGYMRMPVTFSVPFEINSNIGIRNENDLLWPPAPSDIGQVRYIGVLDSPVAGAGNMLLYGELTLPLDIRQSQQPSIYAGDITYFLLGCFSKHFQTRIFNVIRGQNLSGFTPHLALFDGDPEESGVELAGLAYSRPEMAFSPPSKQPSGHSEIQSSGLVRFASPMGIWGMWAFDGLMDSALSGNLVTKAQNPTAELIRKNYVPQVNPGDYRVALN